MDECVFKSRDFKRTAWSCPYENLVVEDRTAYQPCQCVCSAICMCHGVIATKIVDFAFKADTFKELLEDIVGFPGHRD